MRCVYVDFQNISIGLEKRWFSINRKKFYIYMRDKYTITNAKLFIGYIEKYDTFYKQLQSYGYEIIFREAIFTEKRFKANVDTDLVLEVAEDYFTHWLQKCFLLTCDGDFDVLIRFLYKKWIMWGLFISSPGDVSFLLKKYTKETDIYQILEFGNKISD